MKKIIYFIAVFIALFLSACGGDSGSSAPVVKSGSGSATSLDTNDTTDDSSSQSDSNIPPMPPSYDGELPPNIPNS